MLIRKDFKHKTDANGNILSLRVLLIRKDFKRTDEHYSRHFCLRVLLIRKDFKPEETDVQPIHEFESLVNTEGF